MTKLLKYPLLTLLVLASYSINANDTALEQYKYDMIKQGVAQGDEPGEGSIIIDGSDIRVSYKTWADTAGSDDRVVEQGPLGLSEINGTIFGYELKNNDSGFTDGDYHSIDNRRDDEVADFDMVLFSFSEAVALTNTTFKYLIGAGNENQLTVVSFENIDVFKNTPTVYTTWDTIASSDAVASVTHLNISSSPMGLGDYTVTYPTTFKQAKYWLIGAYNTYFDPDRDETDIVEGSGFKLASLGISKQKSSKELNEPGAFVLMCLGLFVLGYKRSQRAKRFKN